LASGWLYLPAAELAQFNLTKIWRASKWTLAGDLHAVPDRTQSPSVCRGVARDSTAEEDGRFAIAAAGDLYRRILDDIEAHDYDVFTRRAHVSTPRKLLALFNLWWKS
jgi:phytoene synthase